MRRRSTPDVAHGATLLAVAVTALPAPAAEIGWSSYLGGSLDDGHAGDDIGVAVDGSGNVYVTGHTHSPDFPTTAGFDTSFAAPGDAWVAKFNAAGSLLWSSYLGGSEPDSSRAIAVGADGSVFVAGFTESPDFPTPGGFDSAVDATGDAFVTRINAAGSALVWSTLLGASGYDDAWGLAVDAIGEVYVVGYTQSPDFPASGGFDPSLGGTTDAFVARIDAAGSALVWASYLGGSDAEYGASLAIDGEGYAYVTGYTASPDFPSSGGFDNSLGGTGDAFVGKIDASGSALAWSSYLGGSDLDSGYAIAVDGSGVYLAGETWSADFPATGGFGTVLDGTSDAFVAKVSAVGDALTWSTYLGGSADDSAEGISVDRSGNVFVIGMTDSPDFLAYGSFDGSLGGLADAFVTQIEASGSAQTWSSYLGGADVDRGYGLALGETGHLFVAGTTASADFPSSGGFDTSLAGGIDAFVTRIVSCGDGRCGGNESCGSCEADCAPCAEPAADGALEEDAGVASVPVGQGCDCGIGSAPGVPPIAWLALLFRRRRRPNQP